MSEIINKDHKIINIPDKIDNSKLILIDSEEKEIFQRLNLNCIDIDQLIKVGVFINLKRSLNIIHNIRYDTYVFVEGLCYYKNDQYSKWFLLKKNLDILDINIPKNFDFNVLSFLKYCDFFDTTQINALELYSIKNYMLKFV